MNEHEYNRRSAEMICTQYAWEDRKFNEGDCVALLDGKVVAVSKNPDDAIHALRALDPDPRRGMVVEVAHPVVDVIR